MTDHHHTTTSAILELLDREPCGMTGGEIAETLRGQHPQAVVWICLRMLTQTWRTVVVGGYRPGADARAQVWKSTRPC